MRVLFVGSWSRSGSTLLDLMLGSLPGFHSAGEIRYLWDRGLGEGQLCGCGVPVPRCPFWNAVLEQAFGSPARVDAGGIRRLRDRADGLAGFARLALPRPPAEVAAYRGVLGRVLDAVARVSGRDTVVDSSKYAAHGLLLAGVPGLDLRVVHLVRDSRAVAYSWRRTVVLPEVPWERRTMPVFPAWKSAAWWTLENLALQRLRRAAARYAVLRYEDLAARPAGALADTLSALDLPAEVSGLRDGVLELGTNHTAAGNPVRFRRGPLPVRADAAWRDGLAARDRRIVTTLTWPLLARYGFARREAR